MERTDQQSHAVSQAAILATERGLWAIKVSLLGLAATAFLQLVVVFISGSAGLLADSIHNFADAATSIPLWVAFVIGSHQATRRFPYGYNRAEDLAGILILLVILASAGFAAYESVVRLLSPEVPKQLMWAMGAALVGFIGNEAVAQFRIQVGEEIGSAALVADGHHARADGLTSLAAFAGLLGVQLGFPLADPVAGLVITGVILLIVFREAGPEVMSRLLDAIDPEIIARIERVSGAISGVHAVHSVRARWLGHRLLADLSIQIDGQLPAIEAHRIAEEVRHALLHDVDFLHDAVIHVDPMERAGGDVHGVTAHHFERRSHGV